MFLDNTACNLASLNVMKFYDREKGFGFVARDDGGDVFVPKSALPEGVDELKPGMRLEFGVAAGKKGEQALSVTIVETPAGLTSARRPAEELSHASGARARRCA